MIRTIVVYAREKVRVAVRGLVEREPGIELVGEARNATDAIETVVREQPHVAILEIGLPDQSGIRVVERIQRQYPRTRSVVLAAELDLALARATFAVGACAFVLERSLDADLAIAIRRARVGQSHLDPALAGRLTPSPRCALAAELSPREREVLRRVALGYTSIEIGEQIGLSPKSIEAYRGRIRQKLGLESRSDIVRYALELGLVGRTIPPGQQRTQ